MRVTHALTVAAAVALLTLTGCGSGSGGTAATATSNGVADQSADQILTATTTAAKAQESVHVSGKGSTAGKAFGLDMKLAKGVGGVGTISMGTDTLQIVYTGTDIYLKGDKAYWTAQANAATADLIGDRWVKAPATNESFAAFAQIGDFTTAVENLLKPDSAITKGDQADVAGQPAIALVSTDGKLWVATTGEPLPITIDNGKPGEELTFSEWGAPVTVTAPVAADTLDLSSLAGG
jgi:hypothetical protein